MRPVIVTVSSQAASRSVPVDWRENNFKIGLGVVVDGTLTYSVQYTFDDIQDSSVTPSWFDLSSLSGITITDSSSIEFPVTAIRINVTAFTSGNVTLTILQAGGR